MLLKKIILHRFKRFFLSGVETFKYIPDNNLAIISWSNGMGKSSFLSQLNPLPADLKKDYRDGGYKYLEFSYNQDEYIVSSGYVDDNKHSFIKNGDELNPGGTISVQKQLVQEHLHLTNNINQILLGIENLTTMSLNSRKYWFTQLSPIDYDYPISVYQNIKSRLRDLLGNIKITQDEIIKRSSSVIDKNTQEEYKKNIETIEKIINQISLGYSNMIKPEYNNDIDEIIKNMKNHIALDLKIEDMVNKNDQELLVMKIKTEQDLKTLKEQLNKYDKMIKVLSKFESKEEVDKLKKTLEDLNLYLKNNMNENINYDNILLCKSEFENIRNNIMRLSETLLNSEYKDIDYKDLSINKTYEDINKLKDLYNKINTDYSVNNEKIKNIIKAKENENVRCPNCNHSWKIGYDEKELKNIQTIQETYKLKLTELKEQYLKLNNLFQKQNLKKEAVSKLLNYLNNPLLKHWLEKIINKLEDTLTFEFINTDLNSITIDIDKQVEIYSKIKIRNEYQEKLNNIEMAMKIKSELQIDSLETIEKNIEDILNKITQCEKYINELDLYIKNRNDISKCKTEITKYIKYRREEFKYNVINKRNDLITEAIGKLKIQLNEISKLINDNDSNKKVIDSLQELINNNKKDIEVLQALVKILSPESGLIAKSMNSFLNIFIEDMNTLINQVWSYPMEILPCEIEDSELSYKFKVKVNHDEIIEDISKLSSSQKEIVDLSFKVMFMKYMHLENYPLFLDEFGKTMDVEHRISAFDVIDKVLTNNFNLTILVCHFESMYTRFVNAQFLELKECKC